MTFRAYLFTYLLGGLTFLPLLTAAILIPAWCLQPRAAKTDQLGCERGGRRNGGHAAPEEPEPAAHTEPAERTRQAEDAAASGTFAVLRRYDFPAAVAAISAHHSSASNNTGDGAVAREATTTSTGESVYQSMYRSVFVGSKNTATTTSLLQSDDAAAAAANRGKVPPANMLYIVLRHGHLLLYDSPAQVEVKHVLSLAHHAVSLQAANDDDEDGMERHIPESDLFTKRTAIVLTPKHLPNAALQAPAQTPAKPFYLFSPTNIDKEDFYHALLSTRPSPPQPTPLSPDALIKLQSSLHSSSLTADTRALDAIIGRVFLSLHHTDLLRNFVRGKIERKLARIQKPTFIPSLQVRSIDLGDAGPIFSTLKLRHLNISGEMTVEANVKYNGGLSLTLLAVAKLDLGPRFKARTVDLVLKTSINRVSGTMLLKVKPPPSNRLWFCFDVVPDMEVRVEPVVSERKITYAFVLRAIEERVRTAISEGLVRPNWDDITMPFTDTRGRATRGGLWSDEGMSDAAGGTPVSTGHSASDGEKAMSMPSLAKPEAIDAAFTTGHSASEVNFARLRHSSTMPLDVDTPRTPEKSPRPPRSPSVSTTSVAMDEQSVSSVRSGDVAVPPRKLWRPKTTAPSAQKDALEELRGIHHRAGMQQTAAESGSEDDAATQDGADAQSIARALDGSVSSISATSRTLSIRSTESDRSTAPSSTFTTRGELLQLKKANILAATAAATNAARAWGWNAIQRNKVNVRAVTQGEIQQPVGRGQPLPPPGQPLPGPNKGLWGGVGNLRRKPAPPLPARKPHATSNAEASSEGGTEVNAGEMRGEEFEPWQENSGIEIDETDVAQPVYESKKRPPPLPARRPRSKEFAASASPSSAERAEEDDPGGAPGLRVPEASAAAINAENLTPERARGEKDDVSRVAHEGVEADVTGDYQAIPTIGGNEGSLLPSQSTLEQDERDQPQTSLEQPMGPQPPATEHESGDAEVSSRVRARV